jgi:CRISPR-associated protein Csa3
MSAERLILLIDKKPDKEQEKSLKLIQESLGRIMDVKVQKTEVYDIVEVARKCVEIIDLMPKEDSVYINITSGRKTKAIGLLFAAYARARRVKKIAYNPEEDRKSVVYLPKLGFNLNESQKKVLEYVDSGNYRSLADLADKINMSKAMLYRSIKELQDMDLVVIGDEGIRLTDAGKIARL